MAFSTEEHGQEYTTTYHLFIKKDDKLISPFHDIPLLADKENNIYNMVVEIPRWTNAKMEISTKHLMNPIKQDVKKGKVRFIHNIFPHKGYIWNYGAIPQTWENPNEIDEETGHKGDGDPIDVLEIGYKIAKRGEVKQIKVLGIMALIDEGETDWKVIAIDNADPLASKLNDIKDVKTVMPGLVEASYDFLKFYKVPGGSEPNKFAFDGEAKDKKFAENIICDTHAQWRQLLSKENENIDLLSCCNVACGESAYKTSQENANKCTQGLQPLTSPAAIPLEVDKVHYINRKKYTCSLQQSEDIHLER